MATTNDEQGMIVEEASKTGAEAAAEHPEQLALHAAREAGELETAAPTGPEMMDIATYVSRVFQNKQDQAAGFKLWMRKQKGTTTKTRADWDAAFQKFSNTPVGG